MSGWIVYSKDGSIERCKLRSLEYGGTAMGERAVTATFDYHSEVAFEVFDYIEYRGERFELEVVPTVKKLSSFEYQYDLRFVSLKYELERCEMRDLVPSDNGVVYPTPLTFSFTGDVRYLTDRIQACLDAMYGSDVWKIIITDGTSSEEKNITIAQQNCWNALALVNSTYGLNFYIKGRTITIGGEQPLVGHTFEYGKGNGLYEIERASDTETGIVTKLRAYGSTRNLDYSYPKKPEWSDSVLPVSFALSPLRLMLPSFKTDGKTDYVLADEAAIAKYGIREASMVYDDIYPSIAGATYNGQAIDEIKAVDAVDESQKTFVVYLHDFGFDLEEHLTTADAQISMKSGALQGYTFTISSIEKQTGGYKITLGKNSLENSEESGAYVPGVNWNMKAGDKFVLLNILMPQKYIRDAENRLLERANEYLAQYSKTNFSYNIGMHDKFLIQNPSVYESLIEGSKLKVYDKEIGINEEVTIQSITITENLEDNILPQVKVTLNNEPSASTLDRIQGKLNEVAAETAANGFTTQSEIMAQYRRKLDKSFFDKLFVAIDANGNEIASTDVITPIAYIKAKYHVASVGGFTMYAMDKDIDVPSLASGLPFDGRTIWYNPDTQQIEVIGGTGGGSGEGVSNFWDLSGIPSWITNTKPKYSYSEIEGTPDLTKYALATDLNALSTKVNNFLEGSDTDTIINKWLELETFLGGLSESDNLATILGNKADKATTLSGYGITDAYTKTNVDNLLKSYATLGGTQTITGEKNFTGGLKVNGSPIYYDTEKKYWKFEGDLLVTGGVTMYGNDSSFVPSTIMDAIMYDSATLGINSNGQLYVKGGAGGGGLDITALQNYLTSNSYLNVTSADNRYLKLSGGALTGNLTIKTTAIIPLEVSSSGMGYKSYISYRNGASSGEDMGCLGFYGKNIPSFRTNSSDGGKEYKLLHENNYSSYALPLSGGTITGTANVITINRTDLNQPCISYEYNGTSYGSIGLLGYGDAFVYNGNTMVIKKIWHEGNLNPSDYLLLTGGTIKGQLTISRFPSTISFLNAQGLALGHIGYGGVNNPVVYMSDGATNYNLLHSGNIDSYNAGSATKLATARTIWGQSFDGTENIDGKLLINTSISGDVLSFNDTRTTQGVLTIRFDRNDVDYGGINWFHDGYNNYAYNSTSHINIGHSTGFVSLGLWTSPLLIADIDKKCVGINTTTPAFVLDINGSVHSTYIKTGDAPPIAFPNYINSSSLIYQQWHTFVGYNGKGFIFGQDNTDSSIARLSIYGGDTTMSYLRIENAVEVSNNSENGSAVLRMCMSQNGTKDQNPNIEFMTGTAYIDWHHAGDTSVDYTTRLIEGAKGILTLKGGLNIDTTLSVTEDAELKKRAFVKNYITFSDLDAPGGANSSTARIGTFDHNEGGIVIQLGKSGTGSNPTKQRFEIINPAWNVALMWVDRNGNMLVNGGVTMYSDQRKKTILGNVELSLKEIANAPLIEHYYNSDDKKTTHVGSIAQYWASMNDWFCKLDSEGFYTMEIQNAALASAISIARELDRYETKTDKDIKKLKKRICELEEEIERLKSS